MKKIILLVFLFAFVAVARFVSVARDDGPLPSRAVSCRDEAAAADPAAAEQPLCADLRSIGEEYDREIRPVFAAKCFSCHGTTPDQPLYAVIPPVKWRVDHNRGHAIEDLDMRYGYPFRAKGTLKKHRHDLGELKEVLDENGMPPWDYKIMHWNSSVTESEKAVILRWIAASRGILQPK